jgi:hypothetical protein
LEVARDLAGRTEPADGLAFDPNQSPKNSTFHLKSLQLKTQGIRYRDAIQAARWISTPISSPGRRERNMAPQTRSTAFTVLLQT